MPQISHSTIQQGEECVSSRTNMSLSDSLNKSRRRPSSQSQSNHNSPNRNVDSVVLSASELDEIKRRAMGSTPDRERRQALEEDKMSKLAERARQRKENMLKMESERKKRVPELSDAEKEQLESNQGLLSRAAQARDEELDDVKQMNQMMNYAHCVTVRDQQIFEKQHLKQKEVEEQRRLDQIMEQNRLKALDREQEQERIRAEERRKGAAVIVDQLREREQERIRLREAKELEAGLMISEMKDRERQAVEERQLKVLAGRKLLEEILTSNQEQAVMKSLKKQQEIDEDRRIAEYLKEKEAIEAQREQEYERKKAEKEKELARLRAKQEKVQDRRAELDALRAKRHQEAQERKLREQEIQEAERRQQIQQEIAEARENQRREKEQRVAEVALQEKREYERIIQWQQDQARQEASTNSTLKQTRYAHRDELLHQIEDNEAKKRQEREKFLEEGRKLIRQQAAEVARLERIKAEKLAKLEKAGIPEKYRAELARKKVLQPELFK